MGGIADTMLVNADVAIAAWVDHPSGWVAQVSSSLGALLAAVGVLSLVRWLNNDWVFFPVFALTASVTVPVLGLFLVFAVLIAPALWRRAGVAWGPVLAGGCLALAVGLLLSWIGDAPSGACVALAMACWGGLSTIKSPPSD